MTFAIASSGNLATVALVIACSLLAFAFLAVLYVRDRTARNKELRWLHENADLVQGSLNRNFEHLDYDGNGVITMEDLDGVLGDNLLTGELVTVAEAVRGQIHVLGHLVDAHTVPMGVGGMQPYCYTHETYGLSRADIKQLKPRLVALINALGRKPEVE